MSSIIEQLQKSIEYEQRLKAQNELITRLTADNELLRATNRLMACRLDKARQQKEQSA